ncbi:MAG: deoxyribodipyrimidine photo-lyase [Candidatus Odinarchaeota archaeon]
MLKEGDHTRGEYVLYWMQASQRVEYNHALEYAILRANSLDLPLLTAFCLVDEFPEANVSHYKFMLEGLQDVKKGLEQEGIGFEVLLGQPSQIIPELAEDASLIVFDRDYLRMQRKWRESVISLVACPVFQIESNAIVPIETVSKKEEYSAGTIRPKMQRILPDYMVALRHRKINNPCPDFGLKGLDITGASDAMKRLRIKNSIEQQIRFQGGTQNAKRELRNFIRNKLDQFGNLRNDPSHDYLSNMSPYLHFGNISPLFVALQIQAIRSPGSEAFLEELIIRRELSLNFVYFNKNYDNPECLPNWAKETLELHAFDPREYSYSFNDLEQAKTHDPYWNAAQTEMVRYGKMHGYMRMYWGKKILEWTESPIEGYEIALRLNNKYELDGRDANGFTGVAWCFGKHDRAWNERLIFGKVRYMNDKGLRRKFNIQSYVDSLLQ